MKVPDAIPGLELECGEPVFNEPWEASAFALVVGLHQKGAFEWKEWADTLSAVIHSSPQDTPYYRSWLDALEFIVTKKSLIEPTELDKREGEWQAALKATPHGSPIELKNGEILGKV